MPVPIPMPKDTEYVCHGVTWATGDPRLLLAPLPGGPLAYAEIMHQRLGFQVTGIGRWCTGRYRFADTVCVEALACPDRAPAEQSGQCARCASRDDFRFAHQFQHGGHAPEALIRYMAQPHWLYVATFADGTTKVGTAAEPRKRSRLDEQGALFATYLTKMPDGRAVRQLEDALTRRLQLSQAIRAAAKLKALACLTDLATARAAHEHHVARVTDALDDMGVPSMLEAWTPPAEGSLLCTAGRERILYPHDLREGRHGFTLVSCIGSQFLAVLDHDDAMGYLLDLGMLAGRRITLGRFSSPGVEVQTTLF
ncbi:DUF2797 domain-containing protein [Sinosporangium siamense]|uniref:DUF2797 domain-containing protein n=1 Tax=Sinosporangium siamense TaxID=1367973 RepID=A0A919RMX5_9ACTN|nr:DUF2797 domain-containing protein [Sinosporangium siamense]GII96727.1 hypothetical protein Ssi02_69580 [Sinosporangium siamense]